jgi:membrane-anchored protein YejM (alkaline phosphatase superfamily)
MKPHEPESPLEELLGQISKWKVEASSDHNDGWTKQHYQRMLDEVKDKLNRALPEIEKGEELDNYD